MKTRSEMLAAKSEKKSSAAERTVPLPMKPSGEVHCDVCEEDMESADLTTRADGFLECSSCGAPLDIKGAPKVTKELEKPKTKSFSKEERKAIEEAKAGKDKSKKNVSDRSDTIPFPTHEPPDPIYCGECASPWVMANGTLFKNCGHSGALPVSDPRLATKIKPPAGVGTPKIPSGEIAHPVSTSASPTITFSNNRLSIGWPEASFPIVDQYNRMKIPSAIVTVELGPNDDRVEVAKKILVELQKIADLSFDVGLAWYKRKLGICQQVK